MTAPKVHTSADFRSAANKMCTWHDAGNTTEFHSEPEFRSAGPRRSPCCSVKPNQCFKNMHELHNLQIVALYLSEHRHVFNHSHTGSILCQIVLWHKRISLNVKSADIQRGGMNDLLWKMFFFFFFFSWHQESITLQLNHCLWFLLSPPLMTFELINEWIETFFFLFLSPQRSVKYKSWALPSLCCTGKLE